MKIMNICGLIILVLAVFTSAAPVVQEWILIEIDEEYFDEGAPTATSMISSVDEELGNFFEGDMVLTSTQHQAIRNANTQRNGLKGLTKRWPNRTLVYQIVRADFDDKEVGMIEDAMLDIASKSCLQFRQREMYEHAVSIQVPSQMDFLNIIFSNQSSDELMVNSMEFYKNVNMLSVFSKSRFKQVSRGAQNSAVVQVIYIMKVSKPLSHIIPVMEPKIFLRVIWGSANGCFSSVGYIASNSDDSEEESVQVLNLSKGCFKHGTVVHEILHTLGFYHMQSTYDRDEYVDIVWENIRTGSEHNFAKYTLDTISDFGVSYDYGSVMHYPENAFSKNGNRTIIPLQEGVVIGQRMGLSESDVLKLNRMYCNGSDAGSSRYMKPWISV